MRWEVLDRVLEMGWTGGCASSDGSRTGIAFVEAKTSDRREAQGDGSVYFDARFFDK